MDTKKNRIRDMVAELYPLHRTLVSDDTDKALDIIKRHLPSSSDYSVETYAPNKQAWTWRVPERYVVNEAYLEIEGGRRIVDFKDNPLHVVSYSPPVDKVLAWDEVKAHLHFSVKRPQAVPWEFSYYARNWGFCMAKEVFDKLPRDKKYHAVIRSEFVAEPKKGLRVGIAKAGPEGGPGRTPDEMLICAHICHPYQANDGISGVAVAIEIANRLSERPLLPGSMSARFLFCPETIGSICYLSHHEDDIPRFKGGIFIEMAGNRNRLALQRTWQDGHLMDRIARYVLKRRVKEFHEGAFLDVVCNDEKVINGPGINIPCISISRWPYDEYHTSDDNMDIIHEDALAETADIVEEIIRVYASNYIPLRVFKGPVFLSGNGLWIDWRENLELNRAMYKIMMRLEGEHSIFDIAEQLNLDYWDVRGYVEKFRAKGLVGLCHIPSQQQGRT